MVFNGCTVYLKRVRIGVAFCAGQAAMVCLGWHDHRRVADLVCVGGCFAMVSSRTWRYHDLIIVTNLSHCIFLCYSRLYKIIY